MKTKAIKRYKYPSEREYHYTANQDESDTSFHEKAVDTYICFIQN